jgi:hypothetical protein
MVGYFPTAVYDSKRFPPYVERSKYRRAKNVGGLLVQVDLIVGIVAGVTPQPRAPRLIGGPTTSPSPR